MNQEHNLAVRGKILTLPGFTMKEYSTQVFHSGPKCCNILNFNLKILIQMILIYFKNLILII